MKTSIIALSLVSLLSSAGEYETVVGLGHQYGGILGAQLAYKTESTKYYGSWGVVGVSAGFQTTFSQNPKHTYGLVFGREELHSEDGFLFLTYDYHFNGFSQNGFVIGTGLGVTREDTGSFFSHTGKRETTTSVTLNFGYKF